MRMRGSRREGSTFSYIFVDLEERNNLLVTDSEGTRYVQVIRHAGKEDT